ncbi:hypothetical protein BS47DRAFT_1368514 [Hydnum rufescens UP504]|uniref:Uncharacterized protein n=1 Tax=Hydnum rufescens UP504 TaxID=1448309 RepID=A0A9P6DN12_9AGAM|nr:hypothetical protein BS47DRAFT_1368514 [Hydnum rufescens UP504]
MDSAGRGNISFNDEDYVPYDAFLDSSEEGETILYYAQDLEVPDGFLQCQLGIDTATKVVSHPDLGCEPHYSTIPFLQNGHMQIAVENAANDYRHPLVPYSFTAPENSCAVVQYLKELGWLHELEGHSPKELMELGALPRKEDKDLIRLKLGVESYFDWMKSVVDGPDFFRSIASGSSTIPIFLSSAWVESAVALDQALHCPGGESDGCVIPTLHLVPSTAFPSSHTYHAYPWEFLVSKGTMWEYICPALHFLFHLVFLLQVHWVTNTRGSPDAQNQWLMEGQPSPYDSMLLIMHYTTTVAYPQMTPPSFTIPSDQRLVSIGPHHVHLKDLPIMYQELTGEMKRLLGEVTKGLDVTLPAEHMEDNLPQHAHNYSFVEQNQHILQPCFLAALNRVHSAPFVIQQQADGQIMWNHHALHGCMATAQKLNAVIMLLVYMSSQPPQITELMSMLITNDENSVQSLYLLPDDMVAMLSYNKSEKLIPQYLHPDFQCHLTQYLVFVQPVEFCFSKEIWGDGTARCVQHNMFYQPGGKLYEDSAQFPEQILVKQGPSILIKCLATSTSVM